MPLTWIVYGLIGLAPFLSYGYASVKFRFEKRAALVELRREMVTTCNARVAEIENQINQAVSVGVAEARAAAEAIEATPETPDDIAALCKRSASCRTRGTLR